MRCLYCGKELALLKRWTGGGEFCSDAHRQQYQEEYNKLALNRLLQAQPSGEQKPEKTPEKIPEKAKESKPKASPEPRALPEPAIAPVVAPAVAEVREPKPQPKLQPKPEPVMEPVRAVAPEPVHQVVAVEPEPEPEEEEAPLEWGFFVELPAPVTAETRAMASGEYDFVRTFQPALPSGNGHVWGLELAEAGQVVLEPSSRILDHVAAKVERKLELREFVRSAPKVDFDLRAAGYAGLLDKSEEPMDILIFPRPPQGSPPLWKEAEQEFAFETQLGALGQVPFGTTGVEDNLDDAGTVRRAAPDPEPQVARAVEAAPEPKPDPVAEKPAPPAPAPAPVPAPTSSRPVAPPVASAPPKVERSSKPLFVRPPTTRPAAAPAAAAVVEKKSDPIPEIATKPLPVTLHGLAAGRGKPLQVFTSALSSSVDVQIPRSNALPLRPVMVLGALPAEEKKVEKIEEKKIEERRPERTVVVKSEPKRPQNGRPDPRFNNGKGGRRPDVRVSEPEPEREKVAVAAVAKEAPAAPKPTPAVRPEPRAEPKPEPKAVPEVRPAALKQPEPELAKPAPMSAPYTPPDLGLPNLSMESSGGFFSKLPMAAKAGAAVVALAGIIAVLTLGNKGKSAADGGQVVEAGTPLAVVDSGWITDWGAEPGVRRVHEISVLKPSLTLSDYRLEFQAQIETKALGWVYRAKDGKNYYVNRLEIVKPGLDPTVALVRFAVINGEEQPRSQFPLSLPVHVDTLYKIRFDAVGDKFTTYVQDQKVDEWTDSRLKMGGVGLYNERGERMSLKGGVNVVPLAIRR